MNIFLLCTMLLLANARPHRYIYLGRPADLPRSFICHRPTVLKLSKGWQGLHATIPMDSTTTFLDTSLQRNYVEFALSRQLKIAIFAARLNIQDLFYFLGRAFPYKVWIDIKAKTGLTDENTDDDIVKWSRELVHHLIIYLS